MTKLTPHTAEWFRALAEKNPAQAAQSQQIVALAGSPDVCGICGDEPATDVEIVAPPPAPGHVTTYRLCDDCIAIKGKMHGERFAPVTPQTPPH